MSVWDALLHVVGFMLPAIMVSLLVTAAGHFFYKKTALSPAIYSKYAINLVACLAVLIMGLIITGRDGKMLTYFAMVIASGTTQWVLSGAWRK